LFARKTSIFKFLLSLIPCCWKVWPSLHANLSLVASI
jgi:hypothetical protein